MNKFFRFLTGYKEMVIADNAHAGREMISPSGEIAIIFNIRHDIGLTMLTTLEVKSNYFDLEIRSPNSFNELFKDWKWIK